jgi:hypothetical protein
MALEVAIGLVFMYLLLALTVTTIQELVASFFGLRARHLYDAIAGMVGEDAREKNAAPIDAIYRHPLVKNLVDKELNAVRGKLPYWRPAGVPSYIPSKTFALVLIDVLRGQRLGDVTGADDLLARAHEVVDGLPPGDLKRSLTLLVADVHTMEQSVERRAALVSQRIEGWFNDRMARASGWYKRKAQVWSLVIGLGVTAAFNANTLRVGERLWNDAGLRGAVVVNAQAFHDAAAGALPPSASALDSLKASSLPLGWSGFELKASAFPMLLLGWVLTTLAVSLGAGFWFDVLGKALNLRGSGGRVSTTTGKVEP